MSVQSQRPLLRGWSHVLAAMASVVSAVFVVARAQGDPVKQAALAAWGVSSVVLFTVSATYHIPRWSPAWKARLRRFDHANIFLMIAATYTPFCVVLLDGALRIIVLSLVFGIGLVGMTTVAPALNLPRRTMVVLYLVQGWVMVVAFPQIAAAIGLRGMLLLLLGGVLYSAGALSYAVRRPRLWQHVFGYHEVFHLLVIAANASFFLAMVLEVVPAQRH